MLRPFIVLSCSLVALGAYAEENKPAAPPRPASDASPSPSKGTSDETPAPLLELLERSGSSRGLNSLPSTVGRMVMRAEKLNDAMSSALVDALAPRRFYRHVLRELTKGYDAVRVQALLAWYRTPLGVRATAMSKAASDEAAVLRTRVLQQRKTPAPPERIALMRALLTAEAPLEALRSAAYALFRGLMRLAQRALPPERMPALAGGGPASDKAQEGFLPLYLAIYEGLSMEELQQLLAFTLSADARWFDAVERRAINRAMEGAGILMGRTMLTRAARARFR